MLNYIGFIFLVVFDYLFFLLLLMSGHSAITRFCVEQALSNQFERLGKCAASEAYSFTQMLLRQ
jgi:hypothetical protein